MVPAEFVWLPDLPLTPNGKIDLARLAASGALESGPPEIGAKPHDELEEVLATIIAGLLGLDAVGTDENFFTLGGHSLLAAQVIARIRDRFDVELPLRDLFDRPTVAEMALSIRQLVIADLDAMSDEDAERLARSGPQ
jgi:acyl carrier protein